jgi:hypothetical protein
VPDAEDRDAAARPSGAGPSGSALTVATYNLYLGADLVPVLRAGTAAELLAGAAQAWADVQASRPVERLQQVARLLSRERPDVVGLQEVALWRTRPMQADGDVDGDGRSEVDDAGWRVHLDALAVLLEALAGLGTPYQAVSITRTFSSSGWDPPIPVAPDLLAELTDRSVLLVRDGLSWSRPASGGYAAALTVEVFGRPLRVDRGWVSVDVHLSGDHGRDVVVRVVNTHLEAFDADARSRQALELVAALGEPPQRPTVVVGDLNCRPLLDGAGDAYEVLLTSGLVDAWTATNPLSDNGFTCGQASDLRNAESTLDHRIDVVLADPAALQPSVSRVVGDTPGDRTPSGLWPSDHAGVVVTLAVL